MGRTSERPNHSVGQSFEVRGESSSGLTSCSELQRKVTRVAMACGCVGSGVLQKMWERPFREGVWSFLGPWDSVLLRTASTHWKVPGKYGPHGELCFFLTKKQVVASNEVLPNPFVSAEPLMACALIGFQNFAAEGEAGSSGSQLLTQENFGDTVVQKP